MFYKKLSAAELTALFASSTLTAELERLTDTKLGHLLQVKITTKVLDKFVPRDTCRVRLDGKLNWDGKLTPVLFLIKLEKSDSHPNWIPWYGHICIGGHHHEFQLASLPAGEIIRVKLDSGDVFPGLDFPKYQGQ